MSACKGRGAGRSGAPIAGAPIAGGEPKPATAELLACTCLKLRKASRRVTQIYEGFLTPAGLTGPQFSLLGNLYAGDGISMNELSRRLVTDATTLNRNLKPLEKLGYLKIESSAADRRQRRIVLTEQGRRKLETAVPLWRQAQRQLETILGSKDFAELNDALGRSLTNLT